MSKDYETSRRVYEEYDPADEEPSWVETTKAYRKKHATLPTGRPAGPQEDAVFCPCGKRFKRSSKALRTHNRHYPALCKKRATF